ncbi:MAG: PQQ-binding-like beta-propeller repeat protein [FCB group bacterium]|jgi:outer membrane protein assembly factor BamB|nr:PQQ-binding-like beta-propeller repeat protein [FCB group bacterium]
MPESPVSLARPRIWPGAVIVVAYLLVALGMSLLGTTNIQNFIGLILVPLGAAVLLGIWWLAASRVPVLDRVLGFVLPASALGLLYCFQESWDGMLLAYAIPAMTVGAVAVLILTQRMVWRRQRWVALVYMMVCASVFAALRVDTVSGGLAPVVSWRWSPTAIERSEALPGIDVQKTASLPAQAGAADWPAFRGAQRDGRVVGTTFHSDWTTPPREVWRRKIGPAWSSFAAVGDYLFTQEQRGSDEAVVCYLAATGEPVWANRVTARYEDKMGLGPRATPTFFEGRLYTQGATGIVQCLEAATGATVWKRSLAEDAGADVPGFGFSSSSLVVGDLVIVFACGDEGKGAVAYKRASGDVAWMAGHGTTTYSSPHFAVLAGVPQVLMVTNGGMQSLAPDTGASLWEHEWKIPTNPRCTQPLLVDDRRVMFGATGTSGSRLLRVEKKDEAWDVGTVWTTKKFRPYFNDYVLHKGYCYGFDGSRFACIDIETGERKWEGHRYDGQVLLVANMDALLVLSEAGDVVLIEATSERFNERARFKALRGKTWNHPVIVNGKLYVRNSEEAACFELRPASAAG